MKLKDSFKGFKTGASKVIAPKETFDTAMEKIKSMESPILDYFYKCDTPSNIPVYRFKGSSVFQVMTCASGANGKGHSKYQALASGSMELIERYSCYKFLSESRKVKISSFDSIKDNLFTIDELYPKITEIIDKGIVTKEELMNLPCKWYKGHTLQGRAVYLPAKLIILGVEGSNGMASGNSLEEALLHAACEIIERHCIFLISENRLNTPFIEIPSLKNFTAKRLIDKFHSLGHKIYLKDFSLGIGIPVIGVIRRISKKYCFISVGVATNPYEALIRALTENAQLGERIEGYQGYCFEKDSHKVPFEEIYYNLASKESIKMEEIPGIEDENMKIELERLDKIIAGQKMKLFFNDTTDKELRIPSVYAFVSGAKKSDRFTRQKGSFPYLPLALFRESTGLKHYDAALDYISGFQKRDKEHRLLYEYYKGVALKLKGDYRGALASFKMVSRQGRGAFLRGNAAMRAELCKAEIEENN